MDICAFMVNGHRYGVPVLSVEEIVRPQPITPVPGSDRRLAGIINLRGVSAAVIDLRRCLSGDGDGDEESIGPLTYLDLAAISPIGHSDFDCRLILMEDSLHLCDEARKQGIEVFNEPVALLVDSMDRVHRLNPDHRHPPPANLRHAFICGVYELDDGFLSEIHVPSIISDLLPSTPASESEDRSG